MVSDLEELLRDAAPHPTRPLDAGALVHRARRQVLAGRLAAGLGGVVVLVAAVLLVPSVVGSNQDLEIAERPDSELPSGERSDAEQLWERTYVSSEVIEDGTPRELVEGTRIELTLQREPPVRDADGEQLVDLDADGFATWQAGCNRSRSQLYLSDGRFQLDGYGESTWMLCPSDELADQDRWIDEFFRSSPTWELRDGRLVLRGDGLTIVFRESPGSGLGIDVAPTDRPAMTDLPDVALPDAQAGPTSLPTLREPTGSLVVATHDGAATFIDVDRPEVTSRQMPELSPGDPPYRLIAGDRLVLYGGERTYAMDPLPDAEVEPITEGTSSFSVFVPSGLPDRFWVRPGRTDGGVEPISQVSVEGEVLLGPTDSPGGNLAVGLADSVVLQRNSELIVWDPQTNEIIVRVDGPFPMGSDGQRFAWCDQTCGQLSVTDPAAGTTRLVAELPDGFSFSGYQGRLSPDGRYLAAPVCIDGRERCALAVLDLVADRSITVADGRLGVGGSVAWSPDSQRVFVALDDGGLATFRPGTPQAMVVPVDKIPTPYGFGVVAAAQEQASHGASVVRLEASDVVPLAAAGTEDASLKDTIVSDTEGLSAVWDMADVAGEAPPLPAGSIGIVVIARNAESTCRSPDDVVGVEIVAGEVVVLLNPDGEFLRPCPGPEGAGSWTAFVVAIPDHYEDGLTGASTRLARP